MTSPVLRYYGGKWKLAPWIIRHFPPHEVYVEPFAGALSVLLQKPPVTLEVANDIEGRVVNFFQVLRDRPKELVRRIRLTPWAESEYRQAATPSPDPLEDARRPAGGQSMKSCGCPPTPPAPWTPGCRYSTSCKERCHDHHCC